ncbi:MAG: hypothetical protein LBV16_09205 [Elusimicrobiota bacterium]|nr:hypothetical protein [Elusimicrobiota bacterium]
MRLTNMINNQTNVSNPTLVGTDLCVCPQLILANHSPFYKFPTTPPPPRRIFIFF